MDQTCRKAVNPCKEICTDLKTSAEGALAELDKYSHTYQNDKKKLKNIIRRAGESTGTCSVASNAVTRNALQAIASVQAAKLSGLW